MLRIVTAFFAALITTSSAVAQVVIAEPWVRATVPQQRATGAFMQITAAAPTRLIEVRSPVAAVVEIHEMALIDNTMRMRQVTGIDMPAGRAVELKPGGYHVMLMELRGQVKEGDKVPLTLVFERGDKEKTRETVEIMAPARPLTARGARDHHKH